MVSLLKTIVCVVAVIIAMPALLYLATLAVMVIFPGDAMNIWPDVLLLLIACAAFGALATLVCLIVARVMG